MTPEPPIRTNLDVQAIAHDFAAEGEPELEFNPGIASRLPRKNVAAGALIRDDADRILFLVPRYKPTLEIPGGLAEDNESPRAACDREIIEELNLPVKLGALLVIDWMPSHGVWRDSLQFIYDGGVLGSSQIDRIELAADEVGGLRFLTLNEAQPSIRPSMVRRLAIALTAMVEGHTLYAEFGHRM